MSRCFPYPPPGYTLSRTKIEALIKLEDERQRIKEQKKKKKKKKKERKERRRHRTEKHTSKGSLHEPDISNEDKFIRKRTSVENDGSGLTEELRASISHSSSSDNSNTGNKRKRHFSHDYGKCFGNQNQLDAHIRSHCQRSKERKPAMKSLPERSLMQKAAAREYKRLFEKWAPPSRFQDSSFRSDEMDWLFDRGDRNTTPPEWPRGDFLHGVNVFAMSLTITSLRFLAQSV